MSRSIKIFTSTWCPDCHRAMRFLKEHGVPFQEINIEHTDGAADLVIAANSGKRRVPTFDVDGRTFHCSPYDPRKLERELDLGAENAGPRRNE